MKSTTPIKIDRATHIAQAQKAIEAGLAAGMSLNQIARESRTNQSYVSQVNSGKAPASMSQEAIEKIVRFGRTLAARRAAEVLPPWYSEIEVCRKIYSGIQHAQITPSIALIYGASGSGKTATAQRYVSQRSGAYYLACSPAVTSEAALLRRIGKVIGSSVTRNSAAELEENIVEMLSGTGAILIIDEAHHLSQRLLDQTRALHDQAKIGVALVGNTPLWDTLVKGAASTQLFTRCNPKLWVETTQLTDAKQFLADGLKRDLTDEESRAIERILAARGGLRQIRKALAAAYLTAHGEDAPIDFVSAAAALAVEKI